jgi:hypothetical protein
VTRSLELLHGDLCGAIRPATEVDWCATTGEGIGERRVARVFTGDGVSKGREHEQEDDSSREWRRLPL